MKYFGLMILPAAWLGFAAHISKLDLARRVPWFHALLLVPSATLYAFMLDDRFGVLFMTTVEGAPDVYGTLWWVHVIYGHGMAAIGSAILAVSALRSPMFSQRLRRCGMVVAAVVPMAGNLIHVLGLVDMGRDPTMLLLGISVLIMRSSVGTTGVLESLPIAPRDLLHQLPIGVILADGRDCIVELSDVASNRLGVFEKYVLGQRLEDVLADGPEGLKIESVEIRQRNQPAGRLVLLR